MKKYYYSVKNLLFHLTQLRLAEWNIIFSISWNQSFKHLQTFIIYILYGAFCPIKFGEQSRQMVVSGLRKDLKNLNSLHSRSIHRHHHLWSVRRQTEYWCPAFCSGKGLMLGALSCKFEPNGNYNVDGYICSTENTVEKPLVSVPFEGCCLFRVQTFANYVTTQ